MIVVVSKDTPDVFHQCVMVSSLKKVKELSQDSEITALVIHNFDEPIFEAGIFISDIQKVSITKIIYINAEPEPMLTMPIQGVHGYIYQDEFYLEDEEELLALLDDIGISPDDNSTALATTDSVTIIKDFIEAFSRNESRIQAPIYLQQVNAALTELEETTRQQELQITSMGTSAIEVFQRASTIITNLNDQKKVIMDKLKEIENAQPISSGRAPLGGGTLFFPSTRYMGQNNVLLIREYSFCRYLTSFVLAYAHYLHYEKNKRVKVVFTVNKGAGIINKYADFTTITQESYSITSLADEEIVVTNVPKQELMLKLTKAPSDVTIIVDRLYGNNDIVTGRVKRLCAVNGYSDIARYKNVGCDISSTIFTTVNHGKLGAFGYIPHIKSYPRERDARTAMYSQNCHALYEKIDNYIGLVN